MSLLGAGGSGGCTLRARATLVERSGRRLSDSTNARKEGNAFLAADDLQLAALCGNVKLGSCNYRQNRDTRASRNEAGYSSGQECSCRVGISLYAPPQTNKYMVLTRSIRRVANKDYWRSEFSEATEARTFEVLKSVDAPANFTSNRPKGSSSGQSKDGPRGEIGDREAGIVVPFDGAGAGLRCDVKVIGVGARACAILSFCQQASLLPAAQFWSYGSDTALQNAQLSDHLEVSSSVSDAAENGGEQDLSSFPGNNSRTVFLVLGAGTGNGLGSAPRQLKVARAKGWLAVGIFIRPFMFEGQKRIDQANQLVENLVDCTDVVLVVEQDALLRGEAVTVSDATDMANNAVLLSISAITELQSGKADITLDPGHRGGISQDRRKLLQNTGKAWLGSGKGQNVREAVERSIADSPAFDSPLVGRKVSVLCTLASASERTREDKVEAGSILRHTLGPEVQLVLNGVINPSLEPGVTLATVIITRFDNGSRRRYEKYLKSGISSTTDSSGNDAASRLQSSGISGSVNIKCSSSGSPLRGSAQEGSWPTVAKSPSGSIDLASDISSFSRQETLRSEPESPEINIEGVSHSQQDRKQQGTVPMKKATVHSFRTRSRYDRWKVEARPGPPQAPIQSPANKRSWLTRGWESGPSSAVAEAWAQARAAARRPTKVISDVTLPVGVRLRNDKPQVGSSDNFDSGVEVDGSNRRESAGPVPVDPDAVPRNSIMDMGLGAVMDMYNAASALVTGKETTDERNQPSLTQRASSMLESERSQKKLTPMVEMEFKNGSYKGRCLAGLPDAKGRLTFPDGSLYDGQWKQGKRAGAGAFYYANGDLFQGYWKDDVMHGKGWMYYHNGDRLYANFWKGKAHGEGRFYSAEGDVFFGQFRDNWRHGECLHIEASGVRWTEIWENGVFISRTPDDS